MIRAASLLLMITALFCAVPTLSARMQTPGPLPSFAGTWAPSDPARSDKLFAVGLTTIPGEGRMTIEQRPDRLTVTITMPDAQLDPLLTISGRFYPTVIYRLSQVRVRPGGAGASGPQRPTVPTWIGDQLVIPDPRPSARPTTATYSLEGERLKIETRVDVDGARTNTVTEWFTKTK